MVEWRDRAIVLEAMKFADHDAILCVFSREHGIYKGVCKAALTKKNRAQMEPGNIADVRWNARLQEHLGKIQLDVDEAIASRVMIDKLKLTTLGSLCSLLKSTLPEHDPHPQLFDAVEGFLHHMAEANAPFEWMSHYIALEVRLLEELGFGLDLSECAATGATENLTHVSPKSGRAVSEQAAAPYIDKLLPLPGFLKESIPSTNWGEMADGLRLTAHFIEHWVLQAIHQPLSPVRARLSQQVDRLKQA
jgi:DNA repair protein RecO (recombination protein O)